MNDSSAAISDSPGWIFGQVRRACRNSLIWNGIALLLLALIAWFSSTYYYHFFLGPFPFDDAKLLEAAKNPEDGSLLGYIELKDRQLLPTGWEEISTSNGKAYSVVPYFMTPVGDQFMLVMAKSPQDGKNLIGPLYKTGDRELGVISFLEKRRPDLRGKFLPVQVNGEAAFTVIGWIGLIVCLPIFSLCLFLFTRSSVAMLQIGTHKIVRQLAKYGDPIDVTAAIDHEMRSGKAIPFGKSILAKNWLLRPTAFGVVAVQLADIVWMYHLKQSESFAVFCLRNGQSIAMPLGAAQVDKMLRELSRRLPWALYGYDSEMVALWRKNPEEIVALSDEKKKSI